MHWCLRTSYCNGLRQSVLLALLRVYWRSPGSGASSKKDELLRTASFAKEVFGWLSLWDVNDFLNKTSMIKLGKFLVKVLKSSLEKFPEIQVDQNAMKFSKWGKPFIHRTFHRFIFHELFPFYKCGHWEPDWQREWLPAFKELPSRCESESWFFPTMLYLRPPHPYQNGQKYKILTTSNAGRM